MEFCELRVSKKKEKNSMPHIHPTSSRVCVSVGGEPNETAIKVSTRVARFYLVETYQTVINIPNENKLYQKAINYIYQMAVKIFQMII
jgi:hypothetical protein